MGEDVVDTIQPKLMAPDVVDTTQSKVSTPEVVDTVLPEASAPAAEDLNVSVEETQINIPYMPELAPTAPVLDDVPCTIPGKVAQSYFFILTAS